MLHYAIAPKKKLNTSEDKDYQNASFLDFLAVSDALGVEIVNDKFIAKIDDFYLEHLAAMRQTENLKQEVKVR